MIPIPDLLHLEPRSTVDTEQLTDLLGLAFTGRETDLAIDRSLAETREESSWQPEFFARDLFVRELIRDAFRLSIDGKRYAVNEAFLERTLTSPPGDVEEVRFRQRIVAELAASETLRTHLERLYSRLYDLTNMFKVPGRQARLDLGSFRVDLFRLAKRIIDSMVEDFAGATSGLARLHEVGRQIQQTPDYEVLAALLDHVDRRSTLNVDLNVGADGHITQLKVREVRENTKNRFYRSPWGRWLEKLRFLTWYGYRLHDHSIVSRLVESVFEKMSPSLTGLLQLLGPLELYLTNLGFRRYAEELGLRVSLPSFDPTRPRQLEGLFNPLLLTHERPPVPGRLRHSAASGVTLITGPNSGGKTRFLQALGLSQLLAQSGLYVPARRANLSLVHGMFVSLIEHEAVEHAEGRLGRELERIRTMFDAMETPSMVILDELCSGTNPSEATEVFSMVLRLLESLEPVAFITTHFLDYTHELAKAPPIASLELLQVEVDPQGRSTYQFIPGVADTSMAAAMAERMGVTFDELSASITRRRRRAALRKAG